MGEPPEPSEDDIVWRELIRANDAVLVSAVEALLSAAKIPHLVLDQNMSVLEGSLGILPRRILVNDCCVDDARQLTRRVEIDHRRHLIIVKEHVPRVPVGMNILLRPG